MKTPFTEKTIFLIDYRATNSGTYLHIGVSEYKLPNAGVQHEAVYTVAVGDDDHGGAAVQRVTSSHDLPEHRTRAPINQCCGSGSGWIIKLLLDPDLGFLFRIRIQQKMKEQINTNFISNSGLCIIVYYCSMK